MLVPYDPFGHRGLNDLLDRVAASQRLYYGSDLAKALGYEDNLSFDEVIRSAIQDCAALEIRVNRHFQVVFRYSDYGMFPDWNLSQMACYLIVMNADRTHRQVAQARLYFLRKLV